MVCRSSSRSKLVGPFPGEVSLEKLEWSSSELSQAGAGLIEGYQPSGDQQVHPQEDDLAAASIESYHFLFWSSSKGSTQRQ
jgi:hypothetical protein